MGNLLATLHSSAWNLRAFDQALTVVQNNVSNADTPGYVKQSLVFEGLRFQPDQGDTGGVKAGPLRSSRDEYAEQAVRDGEQRSNYATETANQLARLEVTLPVGEQAALPKAMTNFFAAASQLSVSPNDLNLRQVLLNQGSTVAQAFQGLAKTLSGELASTDRQVGTAVASINQLASQIKNLNNRIVADAGLKQDANLDAQMHSTLEQLSQYVNVTALPQDDGTVSVLVAGQQSLVDRDHQHLLSVQTTNARADVVYDQNQSITSELSGGKLGALLDSRNVTIPSVQRQVDTLAQTFADQVNAVLRQGVDQSGNPPTQDLFRYNTAASAAATLTVNPLTPAQLAVATASAPGGNGNALQLEALGSATVVQGGTFTSYYAGIASQIGRAKSSADDNQQLETALLTQTQALRDQTSRVSLDEEAAHLVELQRGYQAIAKMITVLDDLTQSVIGILR